MLNNQLQILKTDGENSIILMPAIPNEGHCRGHAAEPIDYLERVQSGKTLVILRDGKPVAEMTPTNDFNVPAQVEPALSLTQSHFISQSTSKRIGATMPRENVQIEVPKEVKGKARQKYLATTRELLKEQTGIAPV